MADGVSAVIFEGSQAQSSVEKMMVQVRHAALLDNLEKLRSVSSLERTYLYTNQSELVEPAARLGASVFLNKIEPQNFHFGRELQAFIAANDLTRVLYLSGAGCPLVTVDELEHVCKKLLQKDDLVYTNNTQSVDLAAFTVVTGFAEADLPTMDNSIALALRDLLGLEMELMPHSLGLLFDIDTPADLLVLGAGPFGGTRTKNAIDQFKLDFSTLEQAKKILSSEYEEVALIGRVGAPIIERMNAVLKLRLRVFSEERGMKSLGRITGGEVVSLLGFLIEHSGLEQFFQYLSTVARCAFIDSRVLIHHYGQDPSDRDRFLSDLGCWQKIENKWLRAFTRAAVRCSIPVVLGGHSLVSGSLWVICSELDPGTVKG